MNKLYLFFLTYIFFTAQGLQAQEAHINEFHYQNAGVDDNEFIEIAVQDGWKNPEHLSVYLYSGSTGKVYHQYYFPSYGNPVSGGKLYVILTPGIQNGTHAMALVDGQSVIEFISYEGVVTATDGPAQGMSSVDIGVAESENASSTGSVFYAEGKWKVNESDFSATPGRLNADQVALPVVLQSFDVKLSNKKVMINWSAALEDDVASYQVQSSTDGRHFTTFIVVKNAKNGGQYSIIDEEVEPGVNFYRLQIVHNNGTYDYSQTLRVFNNNSNPNASLKLLQNPVERDWLLFSITGYEALPTIQIIDAIGKVYGVTVNSFGVQRIDVSHLTHGTYFLRAFDNSASRVVRFVK